MGPIRYIFPAFVLAMWVTCGLGIASGQWTTVHWLMLAVSFLGCAIIFAQFAWVFSYGYAISMVLANGVAMALRPTPAVLLVGSIGIAYGLRLGWFVWARFGSSGYAAIRERGARGDAAVPLPLRLFMWVCCAWLMAFVAMPAWVAGELAAPTLGLYVGAALAVAGLTLEALADQQKQSAKAASPGQFVTTGLYARMRHPNYLGEIIFQLGLIVVAVSAAGSIFTLAAGVLGPLYIAILMVYAARDQDEQQLGRYGGDASYSEYRERTGSLLPG
jgi:steroid 5-alpha reductase family enzyme